MRFVLSLVIALGVSLAVGGLLSFIFGLTLQGAIAVQTCIPGLGWVNGEWPPGLYCFLGALLASAGSGLIALGSLNWRPRVRA